MSIIACISVVVVDDGYTVYDRRLRDDLVTPLEKISTNFTRRPTAGISCHDGIYGICAGDPEHELLLF